MDNANIIALAREIGFDDAGALAVNTITPLQDVRDACSSDKCGAYGHNWTCPPECGTLEECAERLKKYSDGIIIQTVGELEDSFDVEGIMDASERHNTNVRAFAKKIREVYPAALVLGAGGCRICKKCAYPEPCRFPGEALSSMEAYGMFVSQVCTDSGIKYNHGPNTITYTGCALW